MLVRVGVTDHFIYYRVISKGNIFTPRYVLLVYCSTNDQEWTLIRNQSHYTGNSCENLRYHTIGYRISSNNKCNAGGVAPVCLHAMNRNGDKFRINTGRIGRRH